MREIAELSNEDSQPVQILPRLSSVTFAFRGYRQAPMCHHCHYDV